MNQEENQEGTTSPLLSNESVQKENTSLPIIGMGASAGGLEAFEQFFRHVQTDSGMAFVLVPHLDPSHARAY